MSVVVMGVCTARRPKMLSSCLASIANQTLPEGHEVHLVVVDNEAEPNNGRAVAQFASVCPFPVHYAHEPRRGIAIARNAVLDRAEELGADWIAMTDDDCQPAPTWLAEMLKAAERHGADVVRGRHVWVPPKPTPYWYVPPEIHHTYYEGQVLQHCGGGNVLFAGWLAGLRFDERLAHGEDTDFFHRANCRGARIVYSAEPVVYETVPPHRATLRHQVKRAFYYKASRGYFDRRHRRLGAAAVRLVARLLWQVPVAVIRLIPAPLFWLFSERRFKRTVVRSLNRIAAGVGNAAGLAGFVGDPYRREKIADTPMPMPSAASAGNRTIPKKLHLIWVGDDAKRPRRWIDTWRHNHPDWEFRVWTNSDLIGEWETKKQIALMERDGAWSGVANLMRYEILHRYGGVYADADSISVRPLDDWLLDLRMFAVWESEKHRPGLIANTFIGSVPGHEVFRRLIDDIKLMEHPLREFSKKKMRYVPTESWKSCGPRLFTRIVQEVARDSGPESVTILPSSLFLPEHFAGDGQQRRAGLVYARHYWGTTMQVKGREELGYALAGAAP